MAAPAPALAGARRQALLILAVVLLIRLPFLNQAVQGDDIYYLAGAQHAQIDPLHPNHARYAFLGEMVDMRGHPHPPLNCWFLAGLLAIFGDVYEVPFHAAYLLWSLMAALAAWSLAKRFTAQPLAATLLFLATPAFVVNGNSFESDLPFLALWMAALALFITAAEGRSLKWLLGAALSLALAGLAAYQAVLIVPVLWAYLWLRARNWRAGWLVTLVPVATLAAWQLFERASTGALPASVLAGYFQAYGFQDLGRKLANAAALTAHAGWLVFPLLVVAACRRIPRWSWAIVLLGTAGAALLDWNPLFWASFGTGLLLICCCATSLRDASVLSAWVLIFFAGALVLFFAGSARYLLPMAAPVALLVARNLMPQSRGPWDKLQLVSGGIQKRSGQAGGLSYPGAEAIAPETEPLPRNLSKRSRWLIAGASLQLSLGLCLSAVNYQHWDGYRRFVSSLEGESAQKRVWINGEWGLRYYLESDGGLALMRGQPVRPGDLVVSSRLAMPIEFTTGGGALVPLAQWEIRSWLPFRLTALGSRSAYSTIALGLRPFDVGSGPIDVVRAEAVVERRPTLEYLPMNAPEAEQQIVSGVYALESNQWRWMGDRALILLKRPGTPLPLQAVFYIPGNAPARRIWMAVDGQPVAEQVYAGSGLQTLSSGPIAGASESVTVTIAVDRTFSVPGDHRRLGIILSAVGFKAAR